MSSQRRLRRQQERSRVNRDRMLNQARKENATVYHTDLDDRKRDYFVKMVTEQPGYIDLVKEFASVLVKWKAYNPDVILEWQDTHGVLVTGDMSEEHVRRYLAKNDAAAKLLQYADELTGKKASLMQAQFALVGLNWIS